MAETRFDIVADTHGFLSKELLRALEGADYIVHAGDCCSASDYRRMENIAQVFMCRGNNDFAYDYGPGVGRVTSFYRCGLRWQVCHYRERLDPKVADVCICGHTHRPSVERTPSGVLIMNPGSPTYPRSAKGPTIGRIMCIEGLVVSAEIIVLG